MLRLKARSIACAMVAAFFGIRDVFASPVSGATVAVSTEMTESQAILLPSLPPERAIIPAFKDDKGKLLAGRIAFAGIATGMLLSVWGVSVVTDGLGDGFDVKKMHGGIALGAFGGVVSAIAASIYNEIIK